VIESATFTGNDLLVIGRCLELEVRTRMSVDEVRDVIAKSKRATLGVIVKNLSRDTLKAICRAVGISDVGAMQIKSRTFQDSRSTSDSANTIIPLSNQCFDDWGQRFHEVNHFLRRTQC
jgi:hypothetical protein